MRDMEGGSNGVDGDGRDSIGVVAEDDEHLGGGVGADAQALAQRGCVGASEAVEDRVVFADLGVQRLVALRERPQRVFRTCGR